MVMTDKFRIGEKNYVITRPKKLSRQETQEITKLSKELEIARTEGKYEQLASDTDYKPPKDAYKVIESYIKKHNRKLYGGTALNMLLPQGHKIYKRNTLPDFDFFSPEPWIDAVKIADLLYKAGYKFTEAKAGIHKHTFKVFADFWPVADVTYLPPDLYEQVPTVKKNNYTLVSPAYLQMTLYNIISKPIEAPVRWPQVSFRQKLLEQWTAPKYRKKQCSADFIGAADRPDIDPELEKALQVIYKEARKYKLIHYGALAYNKYVTIADGKLRIPVYYYELLTQDAEDYAFKLVDAVSKVTDKKLVQDISYQPYKDMNKLTYILFMELEEEKVPIFTITELTRCIPYKYLGGRYYCSIDYLFYELYNQMFNEEINFYAFDISCLIRYLYYLQQQYYRKKNISELDKSPLQRFVTKCRGPYVNVIRDEFYSRWVDRAKIQSKVTDIIPDGDSINLKGVQGRKIRVYPEDNDECKNLEHTDCKYPCNWIEDLDKCGAIPYTGYKPSGSKPLPVFGGKTVKLKKKSAQV